MIVHKLFCLIFLYTIALAHPHSFIDYNVEVIVNEFGIQGINNNWTFDEMFSYFLLDYDENEDGVFSKEELAILKEEAFDNLKNYNYFSEILINNNKHNISSIKKFSAYIDNSIVRYEFFVPLDLTITNDTNLTLLFYDPTYYIHVEPSKKEKAISFTGTSFFNIFHEIKKSKNHAYFNNWIVPHAHFITIQKKS
jgi:ABC-type uncharacterized transport system substrate-binding protein